MIRIYDWINEVNSKRNRVILGILAGLCYLLMYLIMTGVFTDFNTYYVLDLKFFYTGDEFLIILGSISDAQASVYQVFHYIDYLFVLSFYPLFVLILDKFVVSKEINFYTINSNAFWFFWESIDWYSLASKNITSLCRSIRSIYIA